MPVRAAGPEDASSIELASPAALRRLLGKEALGVSRSCARQRMSYKEKVVLRTKLEAQVAPYTQEVTYPPFFEGEESKRDELAVLPEEVSDMVRGCIVDGVKKVAKGSMSGHELSRFSLVTQYFDSEHCDEDDNGPQIRGGVLFAPTVRVAKYLVRAIGMLEGSLPLDAGGYGPDAYASADEKYEIVKHDLEAAHAIAQSTLWFDPNAARVSVFGNIPTTIHTINAVVDRAEINHPTSEGVAIGDPFPRLVQ